MAYRHRFHTGDFEAANLILGPKQTPEPLFFFFFFFFFFSAGFERGVLIRRDFSHGRWGERKFGRHFDEGRCASNWDG